MDINLDLIQTLLEICLLLISILAESPVIGVGLLTIALLWLVQQDTDKPQ